MKDQQTLGNRIPFSVFTEHDFKVYYLNDNNITMNSTDTITLRHASVMDLFNMYNTFMEAFRKTLTYSMDTLQESYVYTKLPFAKLSPDIKDILVLRKTLSRVSFDLISLLYRDIDYQLTSSNQAATGVKPEPADSLFFSGYWQLPGTEIERMQSVVRGTEPFPNLSREHFRWTPNELSRLRLLTSYVLGFAQTYKTWNPKMDIPDQVESMNVSDQTLSSIKKFVDNITLSMLRSIWTYSGAYSHFHFYPKNKPDKSLWTNNVKFQLEYPGNLVGASVLTNRDGSGDILLNEFGEDDLTQWTFNNE